MLVSPTVDAEVLIHVSVHCAAGDAYRWQGCLEYSNHSLVEIIVRDAFVPCEPAGSLRMPRWWSEEASWRRALLEAEPVTDALGAVLLALSDHAAGAPACQGLDKQTAQCIAYSAALCHGVCAALALDGWVLRPVAPPKGIASKWKPATDAPAPDWLARVAKACAEGDAPRALLAKCYWHLRPEEPAAPPLGCVGMGALLSAPDSHAAWCMKVAD